MLLLWEYEVDCLFFKNMSDKFKAKRNIKYEHTSYIIQYLFIVSSYLPVKYQNILRGEFTRNE